MPPTTVNIPEVPSGLPAAIVKRWKDTYEQAHRESQNDEPEQPSLWAQVALRAANKTLKVRDPETREEAMKLEDWQIAFRGEKKTVAGTVLNVVTRDGKKFSFPVPEGAQKSGGGITLDSMTKPQLVAHAAEVHALELDPSLKKEDMIAKIQDQKKQP
jgi:hypothetical protein